MYVSSVTLSRNSMSVMTLNRVGCDMVTWCRFDSLQWFDTEALWLTLVLDYTQLFWLSCFYFGLHIPDRIARIRNRHIIRLVLLIRLWERFKNVGPTLETRTVAQDNEDATRSNDNSESILFMIPFCFSGCDVTESWWKDVRIQRVALNVHKGLLDTSTSRLWGSGQPGGSTTSTCQSWLRSDPILRAYDTLLSTTSK